MSIRIANNSLARRRIDIRREFRLILVLASALYDQVAA
jgi:hypothetical protein